MQLQVANGALGWIVVDICPRAIVVVPRALKFCKACAIRRHVLHSHDLTDLWIGEPGWAFAVRVLVDGAATEFLAGVLEDPDRVTSLVDIRAISHIRVFANILDNVRVAPSAFTDGIFVVSS